MTIIVTPDTTRTDLLEAITHAAHTASRMTRAVGSGDYATPWDSAHKEVDRLLYLLDTTP